MVAFFLFFLERRMLNITTLMAATITITNTTPPPAPPITMITANQGTMRVVIIACKKIELNYTHTCFTQDS